MKSVGFLILVVISLFGLSCKAGYVSPISTEEIAISGSTVRLKWTYPGDPTEANLLWWFIRRNDSKLEEIAYKNSTHPVHYCNSSLPGVAIEQPATLVLKNVDERNNGDYWIYVQVAGDGGIANAEFYIAVKPNVTINCSSPIKLNEGDDFTCLCTGEGGNPPANVTWFRNGTQFGETRTENNTLTRTNVDEADNATYTCFAQSYPKHAMFTDSKSIVVQVKFKPKDTTIEFTQNPAKLGTSVTMMCKSRGFPEPSYTITVNGTTTVSSEKTYTIHEVKWNDTGTYNCTATNERGSDWAAKFLNVTVLVGPTTPTSTSNGLSTGAIVGIVIGVLALIIISVMVYKKCRQ